MFIKSIFFSVPPHQLLLYDKMGRDVSGVVGPLEEGSDLVLTCEVRGGTCYNEILLITYFLQYFKI